MKKSDIQKNKNIGVKISNVDFFSKCVNYFITLSYIKALINSISEKPYSDKEFLEKFFLIKKLYDEN